MFVGLDLGTSRFRAIGFDDSGRPVAQADTEPQIRYGTDGSAEIDPERTWQSTCALLTAVGSGLAVAGIGVCAQLGVVGIDRAGLPTTSAVLWSDGRATAEAQAIAAVLGGRAQSLTRRPIVPELPAAKIRRLGRVSPDVAARTRTWLSLKDYVVFRLTGELLTDPTHASYTGLYHVTARKWSSTLSDAALLDTARLPEVREAPALAGRVTQEAAEKSGMRPGTPVAVGAPDGTAGAIGGGASRAGVTVDVAGSTDVVFRTVGDPANIRDARLIVNAFAVPGLWAVGGPTGLSGGGALWLAGLLGYETAADMRASLDARGERLTASDGVVFRTELTGGRFPNWDADATGAISGLRPHHRQGHLLRAAEEGSAFLVADALDTIAAETGPLRSVVVVGGLSRDPGALRLRANAWNRAVRAVREAEASALGAAMLGRVAAGEAASLPEATSAMVHAGAIYRATPSQVAALAAVRLAWQQARPAR